jgi:hypothetical protein
MQKAHPAKASSGDFYVFILYVSKHRIIVSASYLMFAIIVIVLLWPIFYVQDDNKPRAEAETWALLGLFIFQLAGFACILLTPTTPLVRRFGFLLIGVAILVGLSEISKLNLRQFLDPKRMSDARVGVPLPLIDNGHDQNAKEVPQNPRILGRGRSSDLLRKL